MGYRPIWVERTVDEALEKPAKVLVCGSYELGSSLINFAIRRGESEPAEEFV